MTDNRKFIELDDAVKEIFLQATRKTGIEHQTKLNIDYNKYDENYALQLINRVFDKLKKDKSAHKNPGVDKLLGKEFTGNEIAAIDALKNLYLQYAKAILDTNLQIKRNTLVETDKNKKIAIKINNIVSMETLTLDLDKVDSLVNQKTSSSALQLFEDKNKLTGTHEKLQEMLIKHEEEFESRTTIHNINYNKK